MSDNTLDRRIVELQFNNKQFEKNAKNSMKTLGELQTSLNMTSTTKNLNKSLDSINNNTSLLATTMSTVGQKWSAWEVIAITALSRITNRVIDLGEQIVKNLTIDQTSAGFDKYNEKLGNTSTLLSQGFDLTTVNEQLEKLLAYTDATSYNFTDMANNIAKFTSAGQGLTESVDAMMGIANWAALSGQNAQKASSVMYQLSQAMSSGYILYKDWMSVETSNMGTIAFKKKAAEIAEATGQLYKISDDLYRTTEGSEYTLQQLFKEGLQDKWFNSDVLMQTTEKFSFAYNETLKLMKNTGNVINSTYEAYDIFKGLINAINEGSDLSEVKKQFEAAGVSVELYTAEIERLQNAMTDETFKNDVLFGINAQSAAQEFRKFEDIGNALRDAISSVWMTISENLIGNAEQAKEVWSGMYDYLEKMFIDIPTLLKDATKVWNEFGGYNDLFANTEDNLGAVYQILNTLAEITDIVKESLFEVFLGIDINASDAADTVGKKFKSITESLKKFADTLNKKVLKHRDTIKNIIKIVFNGIKVIVNVLRIAFNLIKSVAKGLKPLLAIFGGSKGILKILEKVNAKLEKFNKTTKVFDKITTKLTDALTKLVVRVKDLNVIDKIQNGFDAFKKALLNNGKTVESLKTIWRGFTIILSKIGKMILRVLPTIIKYLGKGISKAINLLAKGLSKFIKILDKLSSRFREWHNKPKTIERWNKITGKLNKYVTKLSDALKKFIKRIKETFKSIKWSKILDVLTNIGKRILKIVQIIYKFAKTLVKSGLSKAVNVIKDSFDGLGKSVSKTSSTLSGKTSNKFTKFLDIIKEKLVFLKPLLNEFKSFVKNIAALATVLFQLINMLIEEVVVNLQKLYDKLQKLPHIYKVFEQWKKGGTLKKIGIIAGLLTIVLVLREIFNVIRIASALADSIYAFNRYLRARSFMLIATSIKLIVSSLIELGLSTAALALIPTKVMAKGIARVSELAGLLTLFVGSLALILKAFGNRSILNQKGAKTIFGKAYTNKWEAQTTGIQSTASSIYVMTKALNRLAIALTLMILPIKILGKMNDEKYKKGFERTTSIVTLITFYMASLIVISKTKKDKTDLNAGYIKEITKSLTKLVASIAAIAIIINRMGKMNAETFDQGFTRLVKIVAAIGIGVGLLSVARTLKLAIKGVNEVTKPIKEKGFLKTLYNLGIFIGSIGIAMVTIAAAMKIFNAMSNNELEKGFKIIAGLILSLTSLGIVFGLLSKKLDFSNGDSIGKSLVKTIAPLMTTIATMALMLVMLSKLKWSDIKRGGVAFAIIVGTLTSVFVLFKAFNKIGQKYTPKTKDYSKSSQKNTTQLMLFLATIAGSIATLAGSMYILSRLSWNQIGRATAGLAIIGTTLIGMFAIVKLMNKKQMDLKNSLGTVATLTAIAVSFMGLAVAFKVLGSIGWKSFKIAAASIGVISIVIAALAALT